MNLKNKVAWITGGARIGATVAEELAKRGCHLVLSYRSSRKSAEQTANAVQRYVIRTLLVQADVSKPTDVKRATSQIKKDFGRLDVLVNMASDYERTPYSKIDEKKWRGLMDANLFSTHLTVQAVSPLLKAQRGRVINFADWVAASGRPRYKEFVPYYTAKAGVIGLTQAQALELAPHVLVNAIAPGPILPPADISNEEVTDIKKVTPLGRWGGAAEIAKAVLFFCETDFVTGECMRVDGGRHLY